MSLRTRSTKRLVKKTQRNLVITLLVILFLAYATLTWVLPTFITTIGSLANVFRPDKKVEKSEQDTTLAPPVFTIPFEATNSSKIIITGYATSGSKVKIYLDDNLVEEVDTNDDGSFQVDGFELNLGTNNIYGKTVDEKGKESLSSKTVKIIYDNEKPLLKVSNPEDDQKIQGERRLKVTGESEPEAQVLINDSRTIVSSGGNFSYDLSLNDGENIINIKAIDKASNSTEISRKVTFQP